MMEEDKDIFDRLMGLPGLRLLKPLYRKYKEILLYLFFGVLTTGISIGSYWLFCRAGVDPLAANVLSWILAVLFAYVTNSIWVFEAKPAGLKDRISQMAGFFGGRVATLLMEVAVLLVGIKWMGGDEMAVKIIAQVLVLVGNYLISKFLVFGGRKQKK